MDEWISMMSPTRRAQPGLGLEVRVLDETGFERCTHDVTGALHRAFRVAAAHVPLDQHVAGTIGVQLRTVVQYRIGDREHRRQRFPAHRKAVEVERRDGGALADHQRHRLEMVARLRLREDGLIHVRCRDTVQIHAGHIGVGEDAVHARMGADECVEVAERETRAVMRTADRAQEQAVGRIAVGAEALASIDLFRAVEARQRYADGRPFGRRKRDASRGAAASRLGHRVDDLLVAGAAAQHAVDGGPRTGAVAHLAGVDCGRRGRQHAGRAEAALHRLMREKRVLQAAAAAGAVGEAFDGDDTAPRDLSDRNQARVARVAIDDHRAAAAIALAATFLGAELAQVRAQMVDEPLRVVHRQALPRAVELEPVLLRRNRRAAARGGFANLGQLIRQWMRHVRSPRCSM
ncbi:hypothetical protein ABID76_006907 [Burkholderia ambifaria]